MGGRPARQGEGKVKSRSVGGNTRFVLIRHSMTRAKIGGYEESWFECKNRWRGVTMHNYGHLGSGEAGACLVVTMQELQADFSKCESGHDGVRGVRLPERVRGRVLAEQSS